MKKTQFNKTILVHSIIWALMMIVLSFILRGTEQSSTVMIFMIGAWYISFSMMKSNQDSKSILQRECACIKRFLNIKTP